MLTCKSLGCACCTPQDKHEASDPHLVVQQLKKPVEGEPSVCALVWGW